MTTVTIQEIAEILKELAKSDVLLGSYGNITAEGSIVDTTEPEYKEYISSSFEERAKKFKLENIQKALEEIPHLFQKRKTCSKMASSYGLKHVLEEYRRAKKDDYYISNGDFIIAMKMLGYKTKFGDPPGVNCWFNFTSIKKRKAGDPIIR